MDNFVRSAHKWATKQREAAAASEVFIGMSRASALPILATVVSSEARNVQQRATVEHQVFLFVVKRSDLERLGLRIRARGLSIWHQKARFEISMQSSVEEYNDPFLDEVVIRTVLKEDPDGLHRT